MRVDPILHHITSPRMPYVQRRKDEIIETQHHGQRKLLCSELALLLMLDTDKKYTVVYAGAAPGLHTPFLSEKFENVIFHLYDPRPFGIVETDRIKIYRKTLFTDEIASSYKGKENVVFISDIRSETDEQSIWDDMQQQEEWCFLMKPLLASLKFRLPWMVKNAAGKVVNNLTDLKGQVNVIEDFVKYLDGDVHFPIWGCVSTTECRLVIDREKLGFKKIHYNCDIYEQEMSYFNRETRPSVYDQPCDIENFNQNFDCASEVEILTLYVKKYMTSETHGIRGQEMLNAVRALSNEISKMLKPVYAHPV